MTIASGVIKPLGNLELASYDSLNDNPHQRWQLVREGNSYRIISKFSGLSLEAQQSPSGPIANVRQAYWSSFLRHEWIISEAEGPDVPVSSRNSPKEFDIRLYPNPAQTYFQIETNLDLVQVEITVEVIDLGGKRIISRELSNRRIDFNNQLTQGFYQVVIRSGIGELLSTHKLVINR